MPWLPTWVSPQLKKPSSWQLLQNFAGEYKLIVVDATQGGMRIDFGASYPRSLLQFWGTALTGGDVKLQAESSKGRRFMTTNLLRHTLTGPLAAIRQTEGSHVLDIEFYIGDIF